MPSLTKREKDLREERLRNAILYYENSLTPNIRRAAERFSVPYSTLHGRLRGSGTRVQGQVNMQALTPMEEKAIVRWCSRLDEWGHPARLPVVKAMAEALVQRREKERRIGKHWLSRFLKRQPELVSKVSTRLDRQRALASDSRIISDYFQKVSPAFPMIMLLFIYLYI